MLNLSTYTYLFLVEYCTVLLYLLSLRMQNVYVLYLYPTSISDCRYNFHINIHKTYVLLH
jgi:hypothetical protein